MEINTIKKELEKTIEALKVDKEMTMDEIKSCLEKAVDSLVKVNETRIYGVEVNDSEKNTMVPLEYDLGIFRRFIKQEGNIMKLPIKLEEETPVKFKLFYVQLLVQNPMYLERWIYRLLDGSCEFIAEYNSSNEMTTKLQCTIIDRKYDDRILADWVSDVKIDELFIDKANSIVTKYSDSIKKTDQYKLAMINNQLNDTSIQLTDNIRAYNSNLIQLYAREKSPTILLLPTEEIVNRHERVYDVIVKSEKLTIESILNHEVIKYGNHLILLDTDYKIKDASCIEFLGTQFEPDDASNSNIIKASHISFEKDKNDNTQTLLMLDDGESYVYLYGELAGYFSSSPNLTDKIFTIKNDNGRQLYYNNRLIGPIF